MNLQDGLFASLFQCCKQDIQCCNQDKAVSNKELQQSKGSRWQGIKESARRGFEPEEAKPKRRHLSLVDDHDLIVIEPMEGWSREETSSLVQALRDLPSRSSANSELEHWSRMRRVAQQVRTKSPAECSKCAQYIAGSGVGYFARTHSTPT